MEEISVKSRISVIEKLGVGINHTLGGNYTEPIVAELVRLLKSRTPLNSESPATDTQQPHTAISGLCASCCRGCIFNGVRQGRGKCSDYVGFAPKQQ